MVQVETCTVLAFDVRITIVSARGCRELRLGVCVYLEHLECNLQPSPPGCFTKKLSEARGNGIGVVAAGEAALPS